MEHDILDFLRGNDKILKDKIKEKMQIQSDNMNYEIAREMAIFILRTCFEFVKIGVLK